MSASSAKEFRGCADPPPARAERNPAEASEPDPDVPVTPRRRRTCSPPPWPRRRRPAPSARAHLDAHGGVGGATASHKTSRTFRRKSG